MTAADAEFLRKLRATFKVEAAEHLQTIGTGLLEMEKSAAPAEQAQLIETVFRAAHSLTGAARAVDFTEIESLCQSLEDLFAAWRRGETLPTPATFDIAHRSVDKMSQAIAAPGDADRAGQPVAGPQATPVGQGMPAATVQTSVVASTASLHASLRNICTN